jgi:hypothetical protein
VTNKIPVVVNAISAIAREKSKSKGMNDVKTRAALRKATSLSSNRYMEFSFIQKLKWLSNIF